MGTLDDIRTSFGADFFDRKRSVATDPVWNGLCVCGHLIRYHSDSIGGDYQLPEPFTKIVRGEMITVTTAFGGCVGALKSRGFVEITPTDVDRDALTLVNRINPTCPCAEFDLVAEVDRPNRFFNQRMPLNHDDPVRHPFLVGIRAFSTHLSKRKAAQTDPDWATAEFDRRFVWVDGARVCAISICRETGDGVWPVFVDGTDRSELRCPKHRR